MQNSIPSPVVQGSAEALMDAGLALMVEGGGRRPRVADIVAAAGSSNDAFYRCFGSKDALVEAIVERGARAVVEQVRRCVARAADEGPEAQLRAGLGALVRQASDAEQARRIRAVLANGHGGQATVVSLVDALAALLAQPAAELGAADPLRTARTVAGSVVSALQYWLFTEEVPGPAEVEHLVGFLLAGVRAPRARASEVRGPVARASRARL